MQAVNLLDFDLEGMAAFCDSLGEKRFRATQLFRWIHQKGASDFGQMSDLAKSLRDKLAEAATITPLKVISEHTSADGTVKWLFDVGAGNAIETVFIPEDDRGTLVHLIAGRLRGRLPVLLDGASRLLAQPDHRRDRGAVVAGRACAAPAPEHARIGSSAMSS